MSNLASVDPQSTRSANSGLERSRTLVFADDRSPRADVAWLWICSQRWDGWNVEVITASPTQWGQSNDETVLHPWQPECPRALFAESKLGRVTYLTAAADPRLLLLRAGGLLVLGEHGPGLLKSLHLASTVEWLLRKPAGPMVIARRGSRVERVLVCHDGFDHADDAAATFGRLPWASDTHVTVITAQTPFVDADHARTLAEQTLARYGVHAQAQIRSGEPTVVIKRAIREIEPDLVVLGTSGRSRLERLAVGSTANAIIREGDYSVLVARRPEPEASETTMAVT